MQAEKSNTASNWDRALLEALFREPMSDCLRMLILRDMALIVDETGRAPAATLSQRFRNFFTKRRQEGKGEERDQVFALASGKSPSQCSLDWWQRIVADYAASEVSDFLLVEQDHLAFRSDVWSLWTPAFRKALRNIAETRLIEYFQTHVRGGW